MQTLSPRVKRWDNKPTSAPQVFSKVIAEDGAEYLVTERKGHRFTATLDPETGRWFVVTERLSDHYIYGTGQFYRLLKHCRPFANLSRELFK